MNCIVIDDDKFSRMLIEQFIEKTDFLTYQQSFSNAIDAINFLKEDEETDLIFLDIEMPKMTGIELMQSLKNLPQIIIISAKGKYALEAFEYDVTDYVKKPISHARLFKAASKAYENYKKVANPPQTKDSIFVKTSPSSLVRINYADILWVNALENYIVINTEDNRYTIHFTMKAIIERLPADMFARVHRSYIVNIKRIKMIEDNSIIMQMKNNNEIIPIAKSYKAKLIKALNLVVS